MKNWFYCFGRILLDQSIRLYYRRIEVMGREHIPSTGAAILVANHPNSVTDAFLLASQLTSRKINFIARDAITRRPLTGWIVRKFGVVGVARGMDYERRRELALQRNELAINTCVPRLLAGEMIAIFGEGISTDARRLHMIRKGAMRFGYAAERAAGFKLGMVWIPVGITYSAKQRFRSNVLIRVGEPFRLADLPPDTAGCEAKVLQRGTERLQRDLESLIVNIEKEQLAGLIDNLTELIGSPTGSLASRVEYQQRVTRAVLFFNMAEPSRLRDLEQALSRYQQRLAGAGLTDRVVRQRHPTLTLWVGLLGMVKYSGLIVLNLYGWANGFVPRWMAYLFARLGRSLSHGSVPGQEERHGVVAGKEALWATFGGWLGAALAFPLQTGFVYHWISGWLGFWAGAGAAALYGLSLIPSWRLYVSQVDILDQHYASTHDAFHFLINAAPAVKLQRRRRQLQQRLRALLSAYEVAAPPPGLP